MNSTRVAFDQFVSAVAAHLNENQLGALAFEVSSCALFEGGLSAELSDEVLKLLEDEEFLKHPGSWTLARLIFDAWDDFPNDAQPGLLDGLQRSFDRFSTYLGPFVAAEILAKRLELSRVLPVFRALFASTRPPARTLVPHGLRELTLRTNDPELREQVVSFLNELLNDRDANVRDEALNVLKKLHASIPARS